MQSRPETSADVLVVGAGPTGMACAIEAQKAGFKALIVDKGCLVNSIYHYPNNMVFFTTPELLEIGDIPFTTSLPKPTRLEALEYYRRVAQHYHLPCHYNRPAKCDPRLSCAQDCGRDWLLRSGQ